MYLKTSHPVLLYKCRPARKGFSVNSIIKLTQQSQTLINLSCFEGRKDR
jgi:hypothetical protein